MARTRILAQVVGVETAARQKDNDTGKHPPQVQAIEKRIQVGHYTTTSLSGAIKESRKRELLERSDTLINAVKDAIARANQTPATEITEGETLFGFLFA